MAIPFDFLRLDKRHALKPPNWFGGIFLVAVFVVAASAFIQLRSPQVRAAAIVWDGTGDGVNWSDDSNWVGDVEPGVNDIATFDGTNTNNVTIDTSISVQGIDINSGYTGTITQGAGNTVTVGTGDFDISSGSFVGSNADITMNDEFTISGGTFTATTANLSIKAFTVTSGTFNESTGTVTAISTAATWDVLTTETFNNFTINKGNNTAFTISSGDTLVVTGTLSLVDGRVETGTINAQGSNITQSATFDGGTAEIDFGDAGAQTYTINGGTAPQIRLDSSADASDEILVTADATITDLEITSGFSGSIPLTNSGDNVLSFIAWTQAAGTYDASAQTAWNIRGMTISGGIFTPPVTTTAFSTSATWNIVTSEVFNNLTVAKSNNNILTIASGDTLVVTGTLTLADGRVNTGTIDAQGSVLTQTSGFDGGTGVIDFGSAGAQTFTISGGTAPHIRLDSSADASDSVVITADTTVEEFEITAGFSGTVPLSNSGDNTLSFLEWTQAAGSYDASTQTAWNIRGLTISAGTFTPPITTSIYFTAATWNVNVSETFNNLTIAKSNNNILTIASGDTLVVTGTLTLADGRVNTGTIDAQGSAIVQNSTFDGGSGVIDFGGAGAQTFTLNGGTSPVIRLDSAADASDAIVPTVPTEFTEIRTVAGFVGTIPLDNSGDLLLEFTDWTQEAGTYDASSQTQWDIQGLTISGGTFTPPITTRAYSTQATWDVNGTQAFNNLLVERNNNNNFPIANGDVIIVTGDLTLNDGRFTSTLGYVEAQGDVTVGTNWDGGGGLLQFGGSANQTFDLTGITGGFNSSVEVDKTGGIVSLLSDFTLDEDNRDFTVEEGIFHLNGYSLVVNGLNNTVVVEDGGVFSWEGTETLLFNGTDPEFQSGSAVRFTGDGDAGADTYDVMSFFDNDIEGLIVDATDGATDTFVINESVDWSGPFSLVAGTFETNGNTMNVAGDWSNSGTFSAESNTVILDGSGQSISGSTTFNNLTKTVSSADTLTFEEGETQTILGTMTLQGVDGDLLFLRSSVSDSPTSIDPQGTRNVEYLDVKDNTNANASAIICDTGCEDSGGNTNWTISGGMGGGGGGSYSDASITFSRLKDPTVSDVDIQYTSGSALSDGTIITIDFPAGFTSPVAPTGGTGLGTGPSFGTSGNDFTVTCGTGGCQAGSITITGGQITTPVATGSHIITITNDENSDTTSVAVPIVDDDQVTVTAAVDASFTFDIDTSVADTDTDAPYAVPLGTITSIDTRVSGSTDAINFIWLDLEANVSGGVVVTVQNANGSGGLTSTSVGADQIETSGGVLADNTEEYGICVVSVTQTSGAFQRIGAYTAPTTCAGNDETNDVEVLTTTASTILDTNSAPVAGGRAQIAVGASVTSITPAHSDYTDTITFIATGTF